MDGLSRALGAGVKIKLGGREFELPGMTMDVFAAVEQHMLKGRADPFDIIKDKLKDFPPAAQKMMIEAALADLKKGNKIPPAEVVAWIDTMDGLCFTLWHCLHAKYPDITEQWIKEEVTKIGDAKLAELTRLRDQASGSDVLGNSTGPTQEPAAVVNP